MKSFSIQEALSVGWAAFKTRAGFFIVLLLLFGILLFIPQFFIQQIKLPWLLGILSILFQLFQYFLTVGLIKISLAVAEDKNTQIGDLFSGGDVFVNYVLSSLLFILIIMGGIILLIIPGIIFSIIFQYYGYFIVDKKLGPIEALKASAALTKDVRWKLFGFGLVIALINLLGALLLGLGLFVTVPVSLVAYAYVYQKLLPQINYTLSR